MSLLIAMALFAGLFGRLYELGSRPLSVDEYYFVNSVRFTLEEGVPRFPTGGYYKRGILLQYITTGSILVFGDNAFAYRLPAVLFSILTVALTYFLSRCFLSKPLSLLVALMLAVSSWEIEFARFARMYSDFQCWTVAFFLTFYKAYFEGVNRLRYVPHVFVLLAVLSHEIGVILLPFLFVPLLLRTGETGVSPTTSQLRFAVAGLVTSVVGLFYVRLLSLRNFGVKDALPEHFEPANFAQEVVAFPFWSISEYPQVNLGLVLGLLVLTGGIFAFRRQWANQTTCVYLFLSLLFVSTLVHAFAISLLALSVLIFRYEIYRFTSHDKKTYVFLALSFLCAGIWIVFALADLSWVLGVSNGDLPNALRLTFFGWPDFYVPVFSPWAVSMPFLGFVVGLTVAWQIIFHEKDTIPSLLCNPSMPLIFIFISFGVKAPPMFSTRYTFFVYPLILCVIILSIKEIVQYSRRWTGLYSGATELMAALIGISLFVISEDCNPKHIVNVASPEVAFRFGEYGRYSSHWYPRNDYESAALFLNQNLRNKDDTVLITPETRSVSEYLECDHAFYYSRDDPRFAGISRVRGTVDLWSGHPLMSTYEELRDFSATSDTVWVVWPTDLALHDFEIEGVWQDRLIHFERVFLSIDGRIEVLRLQL